MSRDIVEWGTIYRGQLCIWYVNDIDNSKYDVDEIRQHNCLALAYKKIYNFDIGAC